MKMLDLGILLQAPSIWIELFSIRGKPKWIPSLAGEKPHPDQLQSWSLCFIYPTAVAELLQSRHLRQVGVQCNLMQLFFKANKWISGQRWIAMERACVCAWVSVVLLSSWRAGRQTQHLLADVYCLLTAFLGNEFRRGLEGSLASLTTSPTSAFPMNTAV